jgi:hypothetical protein
VEQMILIIRITTIVSRPSVSCGGYWYELIHIVIEAKIVQLPPNDEESHNSGSLTRYAVGRLPLHHASNGGTCASAAHFYSAFRHICLPFIPDCTVILSTMLLLFYQLGM